MRGGPRPISENPGISWLLHKRRETRESYPQYTLGRATGCLVSHWLPAKVTSARSITDLGCRPKRPTTCARRPTLLSSSLSAQYVFFITAGDECHSAPSTYHNTVIIISRIDEQYVTTARTKWSRHLHAHRRSCCPRIRGINLLPNSYLTVSTTRGWGKFWGRICFCPVSPRHSGFARLLLF